MKLGAGVIATMSALVLGLLISSVKNSYDVASANGAQIGAGLMERLAEHGPETTPLLWRRLSSIGISGRLARELVILSAKPPDSSIREPLGGAA